MTDERVLGHGPAAPRRIISVSDFHLTSGRNAATGLWSTTEDFFDDDAFAEFLAAYDDGETTLVINGDLFDVLQVIDRPSDGQPCVPGSNEWERFGINLAEYDPVYGLRCTEAATRFQLRCVIAGHRALFVAIVRFMAGGNEVKITRGNHDVQLFWPPVQREIVDALTELEAEVAATPHAAPGPASEPRPVPEPGYVKQRLAFLDWFYYVPGLVYIEHGNQYEYTTSFRNFLYPVLPFDNADVGKARIAANQAAPHEKTEQIELDLSGFLVRYLTNPLEPVNPLADNIRPLMRYWEWAWKNYPLLFIQTIGTAARFVIKAFAKAREANSERHRERYAEIDAENLRRIEVLATAHDPTEAGQKQLFEKLKAIDELKATPTLHRGAWRFAWRMLRRMIIGLVALALANVVVWLVTPMFAKWLHTAVDLPSIPAWISWIIAQLWKIRAPQIALLAFFVVLVIWIRVRFRSKGEEGDDTLYGNPVRELRQAAQMIAKSLDVPFIVFGHTHYADVDCFDSGRMYFNTGSWMQIVNEEEQLYRDARQMTFFVLDNRGGAPDARLLRWDASAQRARDVVILRPHVPAEADEDGLLRFFFKNIT